MKVFKIMGDGYITSKDAMKIFEEEISKALQSFERVYYEDFDENGNVIDENGNVIDEQ